MKGMCLIVVGLAFFMVYQTNPMGTLIIVAVILAGYAYIKSRKRGGPRRTGLFFGKGVRSMQESSPVNEIMTMFLVQQILDKNRDNCALTSSQTQEKDKEILELEKKKQEILSLLE
ncbi:MAG: hypothetical protein ACTSR7_01285 [Promethearchaeota archaeon]